MTRHITGEGIDGQSLHYEYDRNPDFCPICYVSVTPKALVATETQVFLGERLQIAFRCPNHDCDRLFIGVYTRSTAGSGSYSPTFRLTDLAPIFPQEITFSDEINGVSPSFIEIYNQAAAAEAYKLNQVAGMGFRKALEFLIKDFLIHVRPADEENIKKVLLGPCINNYVDDSRIKLCAERATWLGNDETHYTRKWVDHDIEDLKTLIRLTVNWVESALLTEKYAKGMVKP